MKNDDLIIIPRREYETVLRIARKRQGGGFDRKLDEAIKNVKSGSVVGPFGSIKALKKSLER